MKLTHDENITSILWSHSQYPILGMLKESSKIKPENILCSHLKNLCYYCLVIKGGNPEVKTKHIFSNIWTCLELDTFKWRRKGQ